MQESNPLIPQIERYLQDLALIAAPSGHEAGVETYMSKVFADLGYHPQTDMAGNCIALASGTSKVSPCIMVFAHMDSLGFFVRHIEENGFIRLERLGGIPEKVLPATRVVVMSRRGDIIHGVIGVKAHHITPPEEKYRVEKYQQLYVDIGASSHQEVLDAGVDVGCPVVYQPSFTCLQNNRVEMTFSDNRAGCATLLMLAKMLRGSVHESDIYLVGTVQEEFNLRGAMMASRTAHPDIGICLDGGGSADTPDLTGYSSVALGGGPILSLYNFHGRGTLNGTIAHPALVRLFEHHAGEANIPLQRSALVGGLTDSAYLQLEGKGVRCIDMGFPGRYTHSPCEVVDLQDIEKLCYLVFRVITSINGKTDLSRRHEEKPYA